MLKKLATITELKIAMLFLILIRIDDSIFKEIDSSVSFNIKEL
jgi:hypothetical protein